MINFYFSFGYSCQNSDSLAIVGFCCTLGKPSEVYLGNGRRSLYSLEVEEKNKPLSQHPIKRPNDLFNIEQWRPELRLVGKYFNKFLIKLVLKKKIFGTEFFFDIFLSKKHSDNFLIAFFQKMQLIWHNWKC